MSVLTGEYFVPQIAQITRMDTEVRRRTVWENVNHRNLNGI